MRTAIVSLGFLASLVAGLVSSTTGVRPPAARQELAVQAGAGSGMYSLTTDASGTPYLSWIEPAGEQKHVLKFSSLAGDTWRAPREIARGSNWFVNWADHPSIAVLGNGSLVAHWLVNNGDKAGSYGYGFRIALSPDGGRAWSEIHAGGTDNRTGYSGFVSLLPTPEGFDAVYLGPPSHHAGESEGDHTMTLGTLRFGADGRRIAETVADADTCSCCSTSMVRTASGTIAAYRDRSSGEIRDISIVRLHGDRWSVPLPVHRDGWQIAACPTNGPSLAAAGNRVAVSWFTGAGNVPRLKAAFSNDGGASFATPQSIDDGRPVGWPSTVLLADGTAVVSWLESLGNGRGEIRVRRVAADGRTGPSVTAAETSSGRSTGIPQMVPYRDRLLLAWRTDRVQTALVAVPSI